MPANTEFVCMHVYLGVARQCKEDEFKCNGSNVCISSHWVCDQDADCSDKSDEVGCRMLFIYHSVVVSLDVCR